MKLETFILMVYVFIMATLCYQYYRVTSQITDGRMETQQIRKEMFILHAEQLKDPEIYKKIIESFEEAK